jgi:hypothetical protein
MISRKTSLELSAMAASGAGLEVDGSAYTALELGAVARSLKPGAGLRIANSDRFTSLECSSIASSKPGQVFFS